MIELIEAKDIKEIFSIWQKIDERTKIHTIQIHALMKEIKTLKGGKDEDGK